jgi:hypothetical protein
LFNCFETPGTRQAYPELFFTKGVVVVVVVVAVVEVQAITPSILDHASKTNKKLSDKLITHIDVRHCGQQTHHSHNPSFAYMCVYVFYLLVFMARGSEGRQSEIKCFFFVGVVVGVVVSFLLFVLWLAHKGNKCSGNYC